MPDDEKTKLEITSVITDVWQGLRQFTPARIALGRTGHSLPTAALLEFQLAHAIARDAVHTPFEYEHLAEQLRQNGYQVLQVHSQAADRNVYLRQPDSGRRLSIESVDFLEDYVQQNDGSYDVVFVLGDGLSAHAIHRNALAVLSLVTIELKKLNWRIAPIVIARYARVALADQIGQILKAEQAAILIGERPGLSAADSMGIYLTYQPAIERLESERNCISNIRPEGLVYKEAASTLLYLMEQVKIGKLSGVDLKDER